LGDLAFLHDLDGLEAASTVARESSSRLVLVVVDNGGGGIFGELPIGRHPTAFERLFLTPRPGDLAGVAQALGASYAAPDLTRLDRELRAALERVGVSVVHVEVERSESAGRRKAAVAEANLRVLEQVLP
jgi:2-succinyl-5-enolpyruvyl-6-hydroxy-3-cyclohexene-1-carboxylate synthase